MARVSLWIWMLLLGLGLGSCTLPDEEVTEQTTDADLQAPIRLIRDDPTEVYDPLRALPWHLETVRYWDLRDQTVARLWTTVRADLRAESTELGLHLRSSKMWQAVELNVRLEASQVDTLEIELEGLEEGRLMLQWAAANRPLDEDHQLEIKPMPGGLEQSFRFEVGGHPHWRGSISRLRLGFVGPQKQSLVLREVAAVRHTLVASEIDASSLGPFKVDLDHEVRNALLAIPDQPLELEIEVGRSAVLVMAYGAQQDAGALELQVDFVSENRPDELVFEQRLKEGRQSREKWQDVRIDLEPWVGLRGRLRFIVEYDDGFSPRQGAAFWAHPEIIPKHRSTHPPNVLMISIDTLRADHLSLYGYARVTSPHLDAFAEQRGVTFEATVASASTTKISHASIFSGLSAHHHGVQHDLVPASLDLLAELLRAEGYLTVGITGGGRLHPQYGFTQGFERYRYFVGEPEDELDTHLEQALDFLDQTREQPFFLFFHTYEVHAPYRVRQPFYDRFGGRGFAGRVSVNPLPGLGKGQPRNWRWVMKDPSGQRVEDWPTEEVQQLVIDRYDSCIAYVDQQLARLFERLDAFSLLDETLVIVTSDHGEAFAEGGRVTHGYLDDSNLLVPLVIATPSTPVAGSRVRQQVRSIDLLPTIFEVLELPVPPGIDGVSLRPFLEGRTTAVPDAWSYVSNSNHGLALRLDSRLKYLFNESVVSPAEGREALFDLRRDPREENNLAGRLDTSSLRQRAVEQLQQTPGLWFEVQNRGELQMRLEIGGAAISGSRVNTWDLPPDQIEQCCAGRLTVEVRPGDRFQLLLDASPDHRFHLALVVGEHSFERPDFRLGREEEWVVSTAVGGWTEADSGSLPEVGLKMEWRGATRQTTQPTIDEELRRQLEALGYVD